VAVDPRADTAVEPNETVVMTLTGGTTNGQAIGLGTSVATGTILNDDVADTTAPTVTITANPPNVPDNTATTITFQFSEEVVGFVTGDVTVSDGTKGTFTKVDADTYTLVVTRTANGNSAMTVTVAAGSYTDLAGNNGAGAAVEVRRDPSNNLTTTPLDLALAASILPDDLLVSTDDQALAANSMGIEDESADPASAVLSVQENLDGVDSASNEQPSSEDASASTLANEEPVPNAGGMDTGVVALEAKAPETVLPAPVASLESNDATQVAVPAVSHDIVTGDAAGTSGLPSPDEAPPVSTSSSEEPASGSAPASDSDTVVVAPETPAGQVIAGTSGVDFLTGGPGSDTFVWHAGELGAVDTISGFSVGDHGDVLAIGALLEGYGAGSDLSQFVHLTESGGGTLVSIDPTGHGEFQDLVLLQGVTGVDLGTLMGHITPYPLA
jgi:hypothetical protein